MKTHAITENILRLSLSLEIPVEKQGAVRKLRIAGRNLSVTNAFDTYWRFAAERQLLYFRRLRGDSIWTLDPILQRHRFTNAYRAADRVSQFLINQVIPQSKSDDRDVLFRVLLFKIFNKIETWLLLEKSLGAISIDSFSPERYGSILERALMRGESIYSAAYIMPSPALGRARKHENHFHLLREIMSSKTCTDIIRANSLRRLYDVLRAVPSLGSFLAFQFAIDLNYTSLFAFSEMEYVVPGPGAIDGIRKCFADVAGFSDSDVIRIMAELAPEQFSRLDIQFESLWGRPLQLIDCQNLFCEVDKYCRIAHPELTGASGRTRIKQRFTMGKGPVPQPGFPPFWGLTTKILPPVPPAPFVQSA